MATIYQIRHLWNIFASVRFDWILQLNFELKSKHILCVTRFSDFGIWVSILLIGGQIKYNIFSVQSTDCVPFLSTWPLNNTIKICLTSSSMVILGCVLIFLVYFVFGIYWVFRFCKHGAGSRESANNRTTFSIWRIFRVPCVFVLTELENRHQYKH